VGSDRNLDGSRLGRNFSDNLQFLGVDHCNSVRVVASDVDARAISGRSGSEWSGAYRDYTFNLTRRMTDTPRPPKSVTKSRSPTTIAKWGIMPTLIVAITRIAVGSMMDTVSSNSLVT